MILTITLNPALDKIYWVKDLKFKGETILSRAYRTHSSAGGKGINVSVFLGRLGVENIAMGFIAGNTGRGMKRSIRDEGVTTNFTWLDGETRTNVAILRKGLEERPISVNEPGPPVPDSGLNQLMSQYKIMLKRSSCVVLSGSIPPKIPKDIYSRMISQAKEQDVRTVVNTGPDYLQSIVEAAPFLLKPDIRESKEVLGQKLVDRDSILKVGKQMVDQGVDYTLISHEITGDILVGKEGYWDLEANRENLEIKNEVGAGDALIGGIVYKLQQEETILDSIKYGMACAMSSVETYDKMARDPSLIRAKLDQVKIEELASE